MKERARRIWIRAGKAYKGMLRLLWRNRGQVLYYGGIAFVLCAFALAAQNLRAERVEEAEGASALPVQETEQAELPQQGRYALPEGSEILRAYSAQPEWCAEMGCWQCHTGVDIAFSDSQVRAVCDGEISAIGRDGSSGGFLNTQGGEEQVRYSSMTPLETLEIGMEVKAGDVLGTADESRVGEAWAGAHLHLEILRDGKTIDPSPLLESGN